MTTSLPHLLALACALALTVTRVSSFEVPFTGCGSDAPMPTALRMNCSSMLRSTCVLRKGQTYLIQADFTPQSSVKEVESGAAWRSWVEMPLTGHDSDACGDHLSCPLTASTPTTYTYPLYIERFWMRRRYPLVWRLRDEDTDDLILCFNFRIHIKS